MKITVPLNEVEEVEPLIEAGADELYCGVYRAEWLSMSSPPNVSPSSRSSLRSFEDLKKIARKAKEYNVPVYITLNAWYYFGEARKLIREDLEKALESGVNGFVVSDIALIKEIRRKCPDKKVILSTMGNCFNTETISFFKDLGIDRVVFPRDLSLNELGDLCDGLKRKHLNVPLEFFVQQLMCRNVNGFCRHHGLKKTKEIHPEKAPCMMSYRATFTSRADNSMEKVFPFRIGEPYRNICAACGIFYFNKFGIEYLKIPGRGLPTKGKIAHVKFIVELRDVLSKQRLSFDEFFKRGQEIFRATYGRSCQQAECHFPCFVKKRMETATND
jgi:collagenase-like PrtC family protease